MTGTAWVWMPKLSLHRCLSVILLLAAVNESPGQGAEISSVTLSPVVSFSPKRLVNLSATAEQTVFFNCSIPLVLFANHNNWRYFASIFSDAPSVAVPVPGLNDTTRGNSNNWITLPLDMRCTQHFRVKGVGLGRATIHLVLTRKQMHNISINASVTQLENFTHVDYDVSVIRKYRLVDTAFKWAVAVTGVLTSFTVGCLTDRKNLYGQLKEPVGTIIAMIIKILVLPPLSLGISRTFNMKKEYSLGLIYTACIPSGGLGYFLTCVFKGDLDLVLAIHFANAVLSPGSFMLWMYLLGLAVESQEKLVPAMEWFVIWLGATTGAYLLGVVLRNSLKHATNYLLEWLIKPSLLLFTLVYITIGMYINSYAFSLMEVHSIIGLSLMPCAAFLLTQIAAHIVQQDRKRRSAISCEVSTFNGLLLLGMIQFTLPRLDADLTAVVPLYIMLLTPIPFLLWMVGHKLKTLLSDKYNNNNLESMKNMERERRNSVASSLINETNVTNLSPTQSLQTGSPDEQQHLGDESEPFMDQVTVL